MEGGGIALHCLGSPRTGAYYSQADPPALHLSIHLFIIEVTVTILNRGFGGLMTYTWWLPIAYALAAVNSTRFMLQTSLQGGLVPSISYREGRY